MYKVVKEAPPGARQIDRDHTHCKVHYRISTIDGKVLVDTIAQGKEKNLHIEKEIVGMKHALRLMREGDVREFYFPAEVRLFSLVSATCPVSDFSVLHLQLGYGDLGVSK